MSATQFDDNPCWRGTLVPAAGELSARFGSVGGRSARGSEVSTDSEKNLRDRISRARRSVRRVVVANCLNQLVTLTFRHPPLAPDEVGLEVANFFRRVRHRYRGVPYVWTLENGGEGGRVHAHALVGDVDGEVLDSLWGLGRTDCKFGGLDAESLRASAAYLLKDLDRCPVLDGQAYRVAKGFQPEGFRIAGGQDPRRILWEASHRMGTEPIRVDEAPRASALTAFWEVPR